MKDARLRKALKKLEQFTRENEDLKLLKDANNTANAAYLDIRRKLVDMNAEAAAACTLVCATEKDPVPNLIGNFEFALENSEGLTREAAIKIEAELLKEVLMDRSE